MAKRPTDEAMKTRALDRWNNEGGAPVSTKRSKRPRDPNQLGKLIVDLSVGEVEDAKPEYDGKNPAAKALGKRGGAAGAKTMSAERRAEIARVAAAKRWAKET